MSCFGSDTTEFKCKRTKSNWQINDYWNCDSFCHNFKYRHKFKFIGKLENLFLCLISLNEQTHSISKYEQATILKFNIEIEMVLKNN